MIKESHKKTDSLYLINKFNEIMHDVSMPFNNERLLNASEVANQIIESTLKAYENICNIYDYKRSLELKEIDKKTWAILVKYINKYIAIDNENIKMLDVGTGNGRDMIYAQNIGYDIHGVDNCNGFIKILQRNYEEGLLKKRNYKKCDMRNLEYLDSTFNVVRQYASLLHLPLISEGFTVDLAIAESYRVLKTNGLICILVKEGGASLELHDTNEGMGARAFQYFTHFTLNEIVMRNGFTIIYTSDEVELRNDKIINWIYLIAQKL
ncbi:MAG: class I SAM-dependent methyltransferase [Lachnospiraceae bacterium]|nr:class I SAM-dependent methyltransferase [Lachnospiraceae bacterium]